jgi:transposase
LARRGPLGVDQSRAGHGAARAGRTRGEPNGGRHRQPIGENLRKRRPKGLYAGKRINGRKRHIVTDTQAHLVGVVVHAADNQDRDGAPLALGAISSAYPWLRHIFADGGYAGHKFEGALAGKGDWTVEIVKRPNAAQGFGVIANRWVVERTFAWLGRCRRLAADFEATIESALAWIYIAHIRRLTRKLARA